MNINPWKTRSSWPPDSVCGFRFQDDSRRALSELSNWYCSRPHWKDTRKCIWHSQCKQKPTAKLQSSKNKGDTNLYGAYLRQTELDSEISFSDCGLHCAIFSESQLREADFSNAQLFQSKFHKCKLKNANFESAYLVEAELVSANLRGANLSNTDCQGVNFTGSDLTFASLSGGDFRNADFSNANLPSDTLADANLQRATFVEAGLPNTNLSEKSLVATDFTEARLSGSNLEGVSLRNAVLENADLEEVNFTQANLQGASFDKADLKGAKFEGADLRGTTLTGATLQGAKLPDAELQSADLSGADLREAIIPNGSLKGVNCSEADLRETDFANDDLRNAKLSNADLRHADLINTDLRDVDFRNSNLEGANLRGADLRGAMLEGIMIHNANIRDVRIDESTDFGDRCKYERLAERQDLEGERNNQSLIKKLRFAVKRFGIRFSGNGENEEELKRSVRTYRRYQRILRENSVISNVRKFRIREKHVERKLALTEGRFGDWLKLVVPRWVSLYGESPVHVVVVSLVLVFVCSLLYPIWGLRESTGVLSYSTGHPTELLSTSVYFSATRFMAPSNGGIVPLGFGKMVATVESFLGAILVALLAYVLGRRVTW